MQQPEISIHPLIGRLRKSIMQIEFRPIEYGKDYDIVHNPDKYVLFIDGTEIK